MLWQPDLDFETCSASSSHGFIRTSCMKIHCNSGNHMLGILSTAEKLRYSWHKSGHATKKICYGAFEDALTGR